MEKKMKSNWLVNVEEIKEEYKDMTLEEVEKKVREEISIMEADKEMCEK